MDETVEKIQDFIEEHEIAFDTPDKKAAFLVGVLAGHLLRVQYKNRKSTPFRSKLHGLKLDERRLKRLFSEIIEKLTEYDVSYPRLQEFISGSLIEAENNGWNLSKDEISYFFALGLNLGGVFK